MINKLNILLAFICGMILTGVIVLQPSVEAAPRRIVIETRGLSLSKIKWAKKNFNPQGQIQDRLEVVEKMLGLRDM